MNLTPSAFTMQEWLKLRAYFLAAMRGESLKPSYIEFHTQELREAAYAFDSAHAQYRHETHEQTNPIESAYESIESDDPEGSSE